MRDLKRSKIGQENPEQQFIDIDKHTESKRTKEFVNLEKPNNYGEPIVISEDNSPVEQKEEVKVPYNQTFILSRLCCPYCGLRRNHSFQSDGTLNLDCVKA